MASAKEIRAHEKSVKELQKITGAMYLISSAKLQKAREDWNRTRPYFSALQTEIKRAFRVNEKIEHPFFYPPDGTREFPGAYGYLVITADRGMAGAYNQNVLRLTEEMLSGGHPSLIFPVGECGRRYFSSRNYPVAKGFTETAQDPTLGRARRIADVLLESFLKGEIRKLYVVYTDFRSALSLSARAERILPFHRADFLSHAPEKEPKTPFEFYPSVEKVLDGIVPSYVTGFLYSALVDSFCSEQSARMNAMSQASDNAGDLLEKLRRDYNHERQNAITREITEISAGCLALAERRKR